MITLSEMLWVILFPLALSAAALLAEVRPWRRSDEQGHGGLGAAIGICGGFAAGFIAIAGRPHFPPGGAEGWLVYLAAAVIAIAAMGKFAPRAATAWASILLLCAMPWLLLNRQQQVLGAAGMWGWIAALAGGSVLWWAAMETLGARTRGGSLPLLLTIVALVEAMALTNARWQTGGQFVVAVAAALVIAPLFVLWTGEISLRHGGMLALAIVLLGLLVAGRHFAELTTRDMIILALAPLAAWAGELPGLGSERSWKRVIVRSAAVLLVLAPVAVPAGRGLWQTMDRERTGELEEGSL